MSDCIEWWGTISTQGYGVLDRRGRQIKAHRYIWEECFGPIPDGMLICHHCDNRRCVNPEHLYVGTHRDNMRDMRVRGRASHEGRPRQDVCQNDHAMTPENLRIIHRTNGQVLRLCLTCARKRDREWRAASVGR